MGKQGSPRSPRPRFESNDMFSSIFKDNQVRTLEGLSGNDPLLGRRMSWGDHQWNRSLFLNGIKSDPAKCGSFKCSVYMAKRKIWMGKHVRNVVLMIAMMGVIFMLDSFMVSVFDSTYTLQNSNSMKSSMLKEEKKAELEDEKPPVIMYSRLLDLASRSLAEKEFQQESSSLWKESHHQASRWKPCADKKVLQGTGKTAKTNGYLLVSANGGLNQQRVAICNAVAVASLLNATLVIPKFLYSTVWKDPSQFRDIYEEDSFIKTLKDEVDIVKELPPYLRSVDVEAIGSQITDTDIEKEAKPVDFIRMVYPLLIKNGLVHLLGFGNRLGFDPVPFNLQRLRCKCNFHALKFSPKIQQAGALLVRRLRKYNVARSTLDKKLLGKFIPSLSIIANDATRGAPKYLALHLRFEEDMVAYSRCDFGGGNDERRELQAYREKHFPLVLERLKYSKQVSATDLRNLGKCPLTPEEAALALAGIGFNRRTYIYLAGSHIYGGRSRMQPFTSLYPNLVTKETLLTPNELSPFRNFSSQLAALDFIACTTADVFAMTDSGSQLSSLVSGFRTYYGGGRAPTLRPNKKRLAAILSENRTIEWNIFEDGIRKMIEEGQRVQVRRFGKSIYRNPRCPECMCKIH